MLDKNFGHFIFVPPFLKARPDRFPFVLILPQKYAEAQWFGEIDLFVAG